MTHLVPPSPSYESVHPDNIVHMNQERGQAHAQTFVGTRGGGGRMRGPCACPGWGDRFPGRTSTRPPPFRRTAPCPYDKADEGLRDGSLPPTQDRTSTGLPPFLLTAPCSYDTSNNCPLPHLVGGDCAVFVAAPVDGLLGGSQVQV